MKNKDDALKVSNVNTRLLATVYFGLLAIIATIFIDVILHLLGVPDVISVFKAILLAAVVGGGFGALYAHQIMHCPKPYKIKTFGWGFLMVITAIPVYNIGLVYFMVQEHVDVFAGTTGVQILYLYLFSLGYMFLLVGLWMGVLAGFAAMYLRSRLVYDLLHSQDIDRELSVDRKTEMHPKATPHRRKHSH